MILTLYYMYATSIQWWRLKCLKTKLNGTLNKQNGLLVWSSVSIINNKPIKCLENLLLTHKNRIACTVVPKQKFNLCQWVKFPNNYRYFPIYFQNISIQLNKDKHIYVLIQAIYDTYAKHQSDVIQVEKFGELIAWRLTDYFEVILRTDIENLTKLVHYFMYNNIDINHELELLRIETIDIDGNPINLNYDKIYLKEQTEKYSCSPVYWKKFVDDLKSLYSKIRDITNPKIKIENGSPQYITRKESKKKLIDTKLLLEETKKIKTDDLDESKKSKMSLEEPKKSKMTLEEPKKSKMILEEPKKSKMTLEEPKKSKMTLEEPKKSKMTLEEPKKTKMTLEEPKKCKMTLEEPKKSKMTLEEPKKSKMLLEEPKKSKMTDEVKISKMADELKKSPKTNESKKSEPISTGAIRKEIKNTLEVSPEMHKRHKTNDKTKKKLLKQKKTTVIKEDSNNCLNDNIFKEKLIVPLISNNLVANFGTNHLNGKPPNILVYADSVITKDNVKQLLCSILNKDRYIIYDLPLNTSYWFKSTILVVVCGSVPSALTSQLIQYFLNGGQLLCLCSDLMYSVLHTFTTAEVREHELVRFSYDRWQHVKMMHHIFCYQASPAKKQFSKDLDSTLINGTISPTTTTTPSGIVDKQRTPSIVELKFNDNIYNILVDILGMEETWHTPSLLLANVKDGAGKAIFSQVHLEIDPNEYENDENKYESLKSSNDARLEILKDILNKHLNIDCTNTSDLETKYVPGFFLGRYDLKLKLLKECSSIVNNQLEINNINVIFYENSNDKTLEVMNDVTLPILIHSCPTTFSTLEYFENLQTDFIGRLLFFIDVIKSTHLLIGKQLTNGFVVIAREQNGGIGRSTNKWLSPLGSASFSLQLHINLNTIMGKYLPLMQNLIIVGIVDGIKQLYPLIDINIKWPNDIYLNKQMKIGGLMVTSIIQSNQAIVNCGCGLNLNNPYPTDYLNREIEKNYNEHLILEKYFTIIFNRIEYLFKQIQTTNNINLLYDLYYKYWLHSNQTIQIRNLKNDVQIATICGIDKYGYLRVRLDNGNEITVQSDGNTFDFMEGLIQPKCF